ncbi:hypothetical protein [Streptomyces griseosporeus]|uniref:hypothetical protein n=1 Tax=Streptomyces griseosporeus TaxID=1910 RepID=UPI0036898581
MPPPRAAAGNEAYHDRGDFLRRWATAAHRPGFALLVAGTTMLVGLRATPPATAGSSLTATENGRAHDHYGAAVSRE